MNRRQIMFGMAALGASGAERPAQAAVNGNATIRGKLGAGEVVISTTDRVAGAIDSLRWNDREFLNSSDHGRQLQSAASFDLGNFNTWWPESYNPTEAGSRRDGSGPTSTSRLLSLATRDGELETSNQMAFYIPPGESSFGHPALNKTLLSEFIHRKKVRIGADLAPSTIRYDVTFTVPRGERHTYAQFEALTGYMPSEFNRFWRFIPSKGEFELLSDGPGEQVYPVVIATESGSHAMGVYSPDQPARGFEEQGYGRFREAGVNKWNCVFRYRHPNAISSGDYTFHMFVVVGSLDDTRLALQALTRPR